MDDQNERALTETEREGQDAIMDEEFDVRQFIGSMGRKSTKKPPTLRRRIEELGEQRDLRAVISDSWED
jgi:hypothetical protein